jgi:hypothetical protein
VFTVLSGSAVESVMLAREAALRPLDSGIQFRASTSLPAERHVLIKSSSNEEGKTHFCLIYSFERDISI